MNLRFVSEVIIAANYHLEKKNAKMPSCSHKEWSNEKRLNMKSARKPLIFVFNNHISALEYLLIYCYFHKTIQINKIKANASNIVCLQLRLIAVSSYIISYFLLAELYLTARSAAYAINLRSLLLVSWI